MLGFCGCSQKAALPAPSVEAPSGSLQAKRVPGQIFSDRLKRGLYGPELVVIPAGNFKLGALSGDKAATDAEKPAHVVALDKDFAISRTEISVAQFGAFIKHSGFKSFADKSGGSEIFDLASGKFIQGKGVNWRYNHIGKPTEDDFPVVHVSFNDATAYVQWLSLQTGESYRLPTEAEWEYVLRAGSESIFPWGKKIKDVRKGNLSGERDKFPNGRVWGNAINNYGDSYWGLAPVGQYSSEGFGTFDMLGNVSEWVEDCWHENYRRAPGNGEAWVNPGCKQRVARGSAWLSSADQSRSSFRMPADADSSNARLGFRVVREL